MYSTPLRALEPLINFPTIFPNHKTRKNSQFLPIPTKILRHDSYRCYLLPRASTNSKPSANSGAGNEDFVARVLRENPSQIEPKYLIGDKLYTLKEKESLSRKGLNEKVSELLKRLNLKALVSKRDSTANFVKPEGDVFLRDLLREYKGKLYVPEQVFGDNISEEEEFEKNVMELPRMRYEDFQKCMMSEKIKLVTFKEDTPVPYDSHWYRDFVVDLKEMPGEKSLHRTKWAMRLDEKQVQDLLERYKGPRNEIEKRMMVLIFVTSTCCVIMNITIIWYSITRLVLPRSRMRKKNSRKSPRNYAMK